MPYSVLVGSTELAFHGIDPVRQSSGCIRLEVDIARQFFEDLQPDNQAEVLP